MKILSEAKVPFTAVVEPQDHYAYQTGSACRQIHELPANNKGIAFVRNEILTIARDRNYKWFWMLDDDITAFLLCEEGRNIRYPAERVLLEAQKVFSRLGRVGQGALEYQQFSWSARKDHTIGYCDVAVCINVERTRGLQYRREMELKEDRDFTLQTLSAGWLTVRASKCAFAAPKNGSNQGGLYDVYRAGLEAEASKRMEVAWPGICKAVTKPDGRQDVKINWRAFKD